VRLQLRDLGRTLQAGRGVEQPAAVLADQHSLLVTHEGHLPRVLLQRAVIGGEHDTRHTPAEHQRRAALGGGELIRLHIQYCDRVEAVQFAEDFDHRAQ
jgi:hypothetical protein